MIKYFSSLRHLFIHLLRLRRLTKNVEKKKTHNINRVFFPYFIEATIDYSTIFFLFAAKEKLSNNWWNDINCKSFPKISFLSFLWPFFSVISHFLWIDSFVFSFVKDEPFIKKNFQFCLWHTNSRFLRSRQTKTLIIVKCQPYFIFVGMRMFFPFYPQ